MYRRTIAVLSAILPLFAVWYLVAEGSPIQWRKCGMFYEWRHGERGWGCWMPISWSDDRGNDLIMDFSRNLIAVGPSAGISDRQRSKGGIVFFEEGANPVELADAPDQLLVFDADGNAFTQPIPSGAARRLRSRLSGLYGREMREQLQKELPIVYQMLDSWREESPEVRP